jgi:2-methylcitrate dehydratase PrpD
LQERAMSDPVSDAERRLRQKIQRQLDEALEDSFPASDPVSIVTSHEEEDWGDTEAPAPPAKPVPRQGS